MPTCRVSVSPNSAGKSASFEEFAERRAKSGGKTRQWSPYWPLNGPPFSRVPKDSCAVAFFIHVPNKDVGFGPKSCGTDGKPTFQGCIQSSFRGLARQKLDCDSKSNGQRSGIIV